MNSLSNFSDEELEAALRRKRSASLADVPTEQLEAALQAKQANSEPLYQRAWNAITGNGAEDLPTIYGSAFTEQNRKAGHSGFRPAMAAVFGDDQDVTNELQRMYPGAAVDQDANGNPVLVMQDGQRFYVNEPGLDWTDVTRFGGKIAQFWPATRAAGALGMLATKAGAGPGLAMTTRLGTAAVGAGATDLAGQVAAGRDKIDTNQTAATAALGGASELIAPGIAAAGRGIRNAFTPDAKHVATGRSLAQQFGLAEVSDDAAQALARRQGEIAAGASPAAIVAEADFGYRLTRGQMTGNEAILRKEELLRSANPNGPLGQLEKFNANATAQNIQRFRQMAAGGTPEAYEQDAAQRVRDALLSSQQANRKAVQHAYAQVPSKDAFASIDDVGALSGRIREALRQNDVALTEQLTPNALTARILIDQATDAVQGAPLRMDRLIDLRKVIGRLGTAATREDARASAVLMKEFDSWFDQSLTHRLMEGGPDAVTPFRNAQKIAREYFRKFEDSKSEGGKAIMRMLVEEATPEQVANVLFNAHGINKPGAATIAKRYMQTVGKDSDGVKAVREIIALRLFENKGDPKSHAALLTSLKDALAGRGRSVMGTMFNQTELAMMNKFARVLDEFLVPKGMLAKTSGTAERITAFLASFAKVPFVNTLSTIASRLAERRAVQPLLPSAPAVTATIVGGSAQARERRRRDQSGGGQ